MGEGGASRGRCAAGGRWLFEGGKAVGLCWHRLSSRGGWPHASPGPSITGGENRPWRSLGGGVSDALAEVEFLRGREFEQLAERRDVDGAAHHGREAGRGAVEVDVFRGKRRGHGAELGARFGIFGFHAGLVGDKEEVERGSGGKGLLASQSAVIAGDDQREAVRGGLVAVNAVGEHGVDIEFLGAQGCGDDDPLRFGTIDAASGPQNVRERLSGERLRVKSARGMAFGDGLHHGQTRVEFGLVELDGGGGGLVLSQRGRGGDDKGKKGEGKGGHRSLHGGLRLVRGGEGE